MPRKRQVATMRTDEFSEYSVWRLGDRRLYPRPEPFDEAEEILDRGLWRDREVWRVIGKVITKDWAQQFPGTRPLAWWRWTAPGPRQDGESEAAYLGRHQLLFPGEERING